MIIINKVFLVGRLTKDPELRYTQSNKASANYSIAVNRNFTNQNGEREADFINVVSWGNQAENLKKYMSKGSKVAVTGRLQTRTYENSDGKLVYITEVVADEVEFLESKKDTNVQVSNLQEEKKKENTPNNVDPFQYFGTTLNSENHTYFSDSDLPF